MRKYRRRLVGAARVLTGLSESSPTAYRHPVVCGVAAWRCDRCGEGMTINGTSSSWSGKHQCSDGWTGRAEPGATQYIGLRAHSSAVWRAFFANMPFVYHDELELARLRQEKIEEMRTAVRAASSRIDAVILKHEGAGGLRSGAGSDPEAAPRPAGARWWGGELLWPRSGGREGEE